jgi:hypothetical protein
MVKNLEINLGNLNGSNASELQPVIEKSFGSLPNIGPYKKMYLAGAHLTPWKDCKPESSSKNTLEMYIFSSPTDVSNCQYYDKSETYLLKGKSYTFTAGQADRITFLEPLTDYDEMADDKGVPLAYRKDNKVWILTDLFHDAKNGETIANFMKEVVKFIEGREHYGIDFVELITGATGKIGKDIYTKLKDEAKSAEANCISYQENYTNALRTMLQANKRLTDYKILDKAECILMAKRLINHRFVAKVLPYNDDGIVVVTKPITNGPFEYGAWSIIFSQKVELIRSIKQLKFCGEAHPYQYSDENKVCLGSFLPEIMSDVGMGKWDDALNCYLLWVTNYSPSTQIHGLIPFLKAQMGPEKFQQEFDKLCAPEITPTTHHDIAISSIYGYEITIVGTDNKTNAMQKKVVTLW